MPDPDFEIGGGGGGEGGAGHPDPYIKAGSWSLKTIFFGPSGIRLV